MTSAPEQESGNRVLAGSWVVLLLLLMIGGGGAGAFGLGTLARDSGLLDGDSPVLIPVWIAGIAVGGMTGMAIAVGLRALPRRLRDGRLGEVARLILVCAGATALGTVAYLGIVGGLVSVCALVLPHGVTEFLAVMLSIFGLPVVGPATYHLVSRGQRRGRAGAQQEAGSATPGQGSRRGGTPCVSGRYSKCHHSLS
ncbi:hypothetical protein [Prauserella flavalba]|uniref:hypothetical protein n=1 Tax=Prauserella flavalba TaxID=1477506 RepID=UPI0011B47C05|nr:hypothetical protein [Prauserella flavalba]